MESRDMEQHSIVKPPPETWLCSICQKAYTLKGSRNRHETVCRRRQAEKEATNEAVTQPTQEQPQEQVSRQQTETGHDTQQDADDSDTEYVEYSEEGMLRLISSLAELLYYLQRDIKDTKWFNKATILRIAEGLEKMVAEERYPDPEEGIRFANMYRSLLD